jgi:hypothetical protein
MVLLQHDVGNEAAFSNKNCLNSSPELLFVAAAGTFMVITEKFVWLVNLLICCDKKETYQADSNFPSNHDTIPYKIFIYFA